MAQLRIISKWTLSVHKTVRYVKDYKCVIIIFGYVKESFIEHFVCEQALTGRGGGKTGTCVQHSFSFGVELVKSVMNKGNKAELCCHYACGLKLSNSRPAAWKQGR